MSESTVTHVRERRRFEITVDGKVAGFLAYREEAGVLAVTHTEVDPAYEGRGLGSVLVAGALEAIDAEGRQVLPYCPFVQRYLTQHPAHVGLVPVDQRARFGLKSA